MKNSDLLVTGAAGFIGFHLSLSSLNHGERVVGIDNLNDYYDPKLKMKRLEILKEHKNFTFLQIDIKDKEELDNLFASCTFDTVVNLAAQAGVRYSIENPYAYMDSNMTGFLNILEACRQHPVRHLVYASSSSVYGGNQKVPFSTEDPVDHPVSLYAATKKANELMAHTYSHLYGIPTTGLRFFTVYGPWGRPDMAYYSFSKNIIQEVPIKVFNHGKMERDFTFIDDVIEGIEKIIPLIPTSNPPYKIYNIGNTKPVPLEEFITILERCLEKKARRQYLDMQPGDVVKTYADISDLTQDTGFTPSTGIEEGLERFVEWYKEYHQE